MVIYTFKSRRKSARFDFLENFRIFKSPYLFSKTELEEFATGKNE